MEIKMQGYDKRQMLKATGLMAAGMLIPMGATASAADKAPNVLFIAVDDLRPELGCYGSTLVKTPNIDRLASMGTVFERAYCQQAVCSPSRVSLLTGQRPDTTKCWDLQTKFRDIQPDIVTLPQYFKNNGYHAYKLGKIFHLGHGQTEDVASWTTVAKAGGRQYIHAKAGEKPTVEAADVPDNAYTDGAIADGAVKALQQFKKDGTPFFLAVGFIKPHLPFCAPKKYWDLYDRDAIPDSPVIEPPRDASAYALANFGELRKYDGIPEQGPVSEAQRKELRHGYLACVSYIDAQVGRLLDALKENGLEENTVIVLWGDHGWKLNDYGEWCKHTNMEIDVHVPLILAAPGHKGVQRSKALVEFVDIYPTLAELCGLPIPAQCEGSSLRPLLETPDRPWKQAAFSQWPKRGTMGYSIRSGDWRYTEWIDVKNGEVKDRELYDHKDSPLATANQVNDPVLADTVKRLSRLLDKGQGWKSIKQKTTFATYPKCRFVANLEAGRNQVVVAYGTSLTEKGVWVSQVADALDKHFPGQAKVINSGKSGMWSRWGVENLSDRVLRHTPDAVFIEFSINDSVARFNATVPIARTNLEAMIDGILAVNPECEIILMTMTPGNAHPEGHRSCRKDIEAHYDMYRSVAKTYNFMLIDHYQNWKALQSQNDGMFLKYVPDSIHPTAEGCTQVVTPVILKALGVDL